MGEGQRPPLEHVGIGMLLDHRAIGGGQLPVLLRPGAAVLEDEPGAVFRSRHGLDDVRHQVQVVVVVHQLLCLRVPPLEVLRTVHAHAVGAEIDLAALHLQQDRAHGGVAVVEVLAVHVRPGEVMAVQRRQPLVVGMAEDHVEDQHLRPLGEVVQGGGEIGQLVRSPALQENRVHRRHARDDHVVAPVGGVRADQLDLDAVLVHRRLGPEVGAGLVDRGGLHRQKLHRVVAEEDLVHRVDRQVIPEPLGQPLELPCQAGERPSGGGGGHVDLQDVGGRTELVRRLSFELRPIRLVAPAALHPVKVVELGRREGTEGQRRGQRIEDAVPLVVLVAPHEGIEVAALLAVARPHAGGGGEGMRLVARHGQVDALEIDGLVRPGQVQRPGGRQHLQEDVPVGDAVIEQFRCPEAEGRPVAVHLAAQRPGDLLVGMEQRLGGGQRAAAGIGEALRRVRVRGDAILQAHGRPFIGSVRSRPRGRGGQARTSGSVLPV